MAVAPLGQDANGTRLHADTAAAAAAVAAVPAASTLLATLAANKLRQAQIDEVVYYMNTGRINPATVLSTLS